MALTIARVDVATLDIPMKKPFGIAGGAHELARNVLVTVELEDGTRGIGEAAPLPVFDGETQELAIEAIERAKPKLVGVDAGAWFADLPDAIEEATSPIGSAACALETAVLDAFARARGRSLREIFGGAETWLVTDVTITTGTIEEAVAEARAFAEFSTLKIKVGASDVDTDVARVLAIRDARPDARLLLDANASLDVDRALRMLDELAKHRCVPALFEQPISIRGDALGALDALAEIRKRSSVPVAIDESARNAGDVIRAQRAGAADVVNVKLMKAGVRNAMEVAVAARSCGLGLMIGGMVEARVAMGTSACFAAGLGGFSFVDLDTPLFLAKDPFEGGYAQDGARIDLRPIKAGHGCELRSET
ncbi:MAG TPA: dipeptide epimerase [Labilithrix sp.]